jgi:hypothetical protein
LGLGVAHVGVEPKQPEPRGQHALRRVEQPLERGHEGERAHGGGAAGRRVGEEGGLEQRPEVPRLERLLRARLRVRVKG